jgi:molybdopterin converting factor subunit 1
MFVTVRLFARLREVTGQPELSRELPPGATAGSAWAALVQDFPGLADYGRTVSCAVNEEYARMTTTLNDGDEVAFLPPVSGGECTEGTEGTEKTFLTQRLGDYGDSEIFRESSGVEDRSTDL